MKEALLYIPLDNLAVRCRLCAHSCKIGEGKFGFCGVRQNIGGILYANNYGKIVAANVDPVEKKPLYHFLPGTKTFSIASAGCNFRCGFCQNWQISQTNYIDQNLKKEVSAAQIVRLAQQHGCRSIAYTYTEPTVYFEFALETAKLAKVAGLYNIFVTNGYLSAPAIEMLLPYLDAVNVDLKFFKESSYQKICCAKLKPVLDTIQFLNDAKIWTEITTLVIPGENDTASELSAIANFIIGVNRNIPWHLCAFHAEYKFNTYPSTPENTLKMAFDLGKKQGLNYVYAGNVTGWGEDTFCSNCRKALIKRVGFVVTENNVLANKCKFCNAELAGLVIS